MLGVSGEEKGELFFWDATELGSLIFSGSFNLSRVHDVLEMSKFWLELKVTGQEY